MQIKPLFDRVLLKPEQEQITTSGIYIPQSTAERSHIMQVVALGTGEFAVAPGDRIVVHKYAGTELAVGNDKFYIVKQCDILAKIDDAITRHCKEHRNEPTKKIG